MNVEWGGNPQLRQRSRLSFAQGRVRGIGLGSNLDRGCGERRLSSPDVACRAMTNDENSETSQEQTRALSVDDLPTPSNSSEQAKARATRLADRRQHEALLTFRVGGSWLAVPARYVDEVCDESTSIPVPGAPSYVPGLINIRGHAVPLLDLRRFLDLPSEDDSGPHTMRGFDDAQRVRIVLVVANGMRVGLLCDQIRSLEQVPEDELHKPQAVQGRMLEHIAGQELERDDYVAPVLDVGALLEAARVRR